MLKTFFINSTQADYGEVELNYLQKFLLDQGVLHTQGANWNDFIDLAVSENDTPDMSVNVAIGNAVIETERNSVAFKVFVFNNAEVNLPISDNSSGDTRMDAIILKLSRTVEPNALMNNVATIEVVDGTSAVALTDNAIQTEIGADYDFLRLANVAVDDSETTILDADIGDARTRVLTTDSIQYSPTVLKFKVVTADPSSPVEGEMWYNETDNKMRYYDGTAVINIETSSFSGGDGIDITSGTISVDLATDSGLKFDGGKLKVIGSGNLLGDGSDGSVTISTNTTLTEDKNYTDLTINSGVTLETDGYIIRCTGTITNNGTIKNNGGVGGNASTYNGGNGALGNTHRGSLPPEVGGKKGLKGSTSSGTPVDGSDGNFAFLMPITFAEISKNFFSDIITLIQSLPPNIYSAGGSGGSRSQNGYSGGGGGGGASGGNILIFANNITNSVTGIIQANGGNGGNGGGGGGDDNYGGNGGDGGNGGNILLAYSGTYSNSGTVECSGGNGGNGGGTDPTWYGSDGSAGTAGTVTSIQF